MHKNSPYESFGGNPIIYADPTGLDTIQFNKSTVIVVNPDGRLSGKSSIGISTIRASGKDVYVFNNSVTSVDRNGGTVTTKTSQILNPDDPDSENGFTTGKDLWFDGLWTTDRKNYDWESIGKMMDVDRDFYDYMISRHPESAFWRSRALAIYAMESVLPVLVQSGFSSYAGFYMSVEPQYVYRALTEQQVATFERGEGIFPKAPNGTWSLEDHLIKGSSKGALENDPWLSTTTDVKIAESFAGENGTIVKIHLGSIPKSSIQRGWISLPRSSAGYHYSIWQQEVSILGHIEQRSISLYER